MNFDSHEHADKIVNKGKFIESLSEEQFNAGTIKFNIPREDDSSCGEGVWGWVTPEDKEKYDDNNYHGELVAILLNQPLNYFGKLNWGDEVKLKCHGESRPTLDPDWVRERLQ